MCKNSGFRSRIQKSYKKFGIESKNLIIFSESIPNLYPLCFLGFTQIAQISQGFFVGGKSHGGSMVCGFLWAHTDLTDLTGFLCGWEISRMLYGLWFFVGSHGFCEIQREDYLWKFVISWLKITPI